MNSSLYQFTFPNGKSYIGISSSPKNRWKNHKTSSARGKGFAVHAAIRKCGWENVEKKVLCIGSEKYIKELEKKAVISFNTKPPFGYNLTDGGDGTTGVAFSEKRREEIRKRMLGNSYTKGIKFSKERINVQKGKLKHTDEFKQKISSIMKGKVVSEETRKKIQEAALNRPEWTEERKATHSKILKGNARKKGIAVSESQKEQHRLFHTSVKKFIQDSGFKGSARNVTKVMIEEFYEKGQ